MLDKVLVVIPARGGSKGVPGKNIKPLAGKPLILYSVEAALEIFPASQVYVSSDDRKIIAKVEESGLTVPFVRPAELSTDTAGTYEVLLHAVRHAESIGFWPEIVLLLQPTSPFRAAKHIREALALFHNGLDMVVSVKETKANPYYVLFEEEGKEPYLKRSKSASFIRRQDCPRVWELNGAIYVINVGSLKTKPIVEFTRSVKYVMDDLSSHDIDTPLDWMVAEVIVKELQSKDVL